MSPRFIPSFALLGMLATSPIASARERIPTGAESRHAAAEQFFKAYKAHDVKAATEVAGDGPVHDIAQTRRAGRNPSLPLIDDTHIYYEGGSLALNIVKNSAGRCT